MYFADGSVYEGEWYNNLRNGEGMLRLGNFHFCGIPHMICSYVRASRTELIKNISKDWFGAISLILANPNELLGLRKKKTLYLHEGST